MIVTIAATSAAVIERIQSHAHLGPGLTAKRRIKLGKPEPLHVRSRLLRRGFAKLDAAVDLIGDDRVPFRLARHLRECDVFCRIEKKLRVMLGQTRRRQKIRRVRNRFQRRNRQPKLRLHLRPLAAAQVFHQVKRFVRMRRARRHRPGGVINLAGLELFCLVWVGNKIPFEIGDVLERGTFHRPTGPSQPMLPL